MVKPWLNHGITMVIMVKPWFIFIRVSLDILLLSFENNSLNRRDDGK